MTRIRGFLSYANVTATLALFIVLGGGAYAATQLAANSVGTKQLRKNAVTSVKVKNGSLLRQDFKAGQIPAGLQGPKGDIGPKGDPGPPGGTLSAVATAQGTSGASNVTVFLPSDFAFTPAADKADIVLVNVVWTPPAASCSGLGGRVTINFDNAQIASQDAGKGAGTQRLTGTASVVSSATPASHTVTVGLADDCSGSENVDATATVQRFEVG